MLRKRTLSSPLSSTRPESRVRIFVDLSDLNSTPPPPRTNTTYVTPSTSAEVGAFGIDKKVHFNEDADSESPCSSVSYSVIDLTSPFSPGDTSQTMLLKMLLPTLLTSHPLLRQLKLILPDTRGQDSSRMLHTV